MISQIIYYGFNYINFLMSFRLLKYFHSFPYLLLVSLNILWHSLLSSLILVSTLVNFLVVPSTIILESLFTITVPKTLLTSFSCSYVNASISFFFSSILLCACSKTSLLLSCIPMFIFTTTCYSFCYVRFFSYTHSLIYFLKYLLFSFYIILLYLRNICIYFLFSFTVFFFCSIGTVFY